MRYFTQRSRMHCVGIAEGTCPSDRIRSCIKTAFLILSQPWSESDSFFIREAGTNNIESTIERGRALWDSIYQPHAVKLHDKLGSYHPDFICKSIGSVHVGPGFLRISSFTRQGIHSFRIKVPCAPIAYLADLTFLHLLVKIVC